MQKCTLLCRYLPVSTFLMYTRDARCFGWGSLLSHHEPIGIWRSTHIHHILYFFIQSSCHLTTVLIIRYRHPSSQYISKRSGQRSAQSYLVSLTKLLSDPLLHTRITSLAIRMVLRDRFTRRYDARTLAHKTQFPVT
jgi:hypothetical protein